MQVANLHLTSATPALRIYLFPTSHLRHCDSMWIGASSAQWLGKFEQGSATVWALKLTYRELTLVGD